MRATVVQVGDIWTYSTKAGGGTLDEYNSYIVMRVYKARDWRISKKNKMVWTYDFICMLTGDHRSAYSLMSGLCLSTAGYWRKDA